MANGGVRGKRWANMLHNRPVCSGVDYFINNIKANKSSLMDKNAGGGLKPKSGNGNRRNEKAHLEGSDFEPFSYEWVFVILKPKYKEQEGVPIVRIISQLSSIDRVGYSELEQGVRSPEGIRDWVIKKRNDIESSG